MQTYRIVASTVGTGGEYGDVLGLSNVQLYEAMIALQTAVFNAKPGTLFDVEITKNVDEEA